MKSLTTRKLVIAGLLVAISIILDQTPFGTLRLPIINATIAHIPTIIGGILAGPVVGFIVGVSFGLSSLMRNLTQPTSVLFFVFINPVVSVVPRALVGVLSHYGYVWTQKYMGNMLGIAAGAIIGSATNTLGVLGMMYVFYAADIVEKLDPSSTASAILTSIALAHGIPELIVAAVLTTVVIKALQPLVKEE